MYVSEDEWLCRDMDIKSCLSWKRIRKNHMFREKYTRNPRSCLAVGSTYKIYIRNSKKILFQTMRKISTSAYQCFILLAILCKVARTLFSVFLAGKLRINSFDKYKQLSG